MDRVLRIAGAQMGPNSRHDSRADILARMIALLETAGRQGAQLVVFPELAFTTFFPRWLVASDAELDRYFERAMPNSNVAPLFDRARSLAIGFHVGYAELTPQGERYNTAVLVGSDGKLLLKYRKVHLPGTTEPKPGLRFQQLEKRYFRYGDLGFPVIRTGPAWADAAIGILICNDRRWPEGWRVLGLQSVELVLIGYNSAAYDPGGGDTEAQYLLQAGKGDLVSQWIYALVAPFPTITDGISQTELLDVWQGNAEQAFTGSPLLMDEATLGVFQAVWGEPGTARRPGHIPGLGVSMQNNLHA